jgi:hypothetical protein
MDPATIAAAVGSALIAAMTTDAWEQARSTIVQLWRHVHPERAETIAAELADTREEVLAARRSGAVEVEAALAEDWERRLRRLLGVDPNVAAELQQVLDDVLVPALGLADRERIYSIVTKTQTINARDNSMVWAVMDGTMNVQNAPPVESKSAAADSDGSSPTSDRDEG